MRVGELYQLTFLELQRVEDEEKRRAAREAEILRLEKEEADLLERLKNAQVH